MTTEKYVPLPDELKLREVRVRVTQRGFRPQEVLVVRSLLDPVQCLAAEIAELHHLRCMTPHRMRSEFYMHLLAYNLIRLTLADAVRSAEVQL